MHKFFNILDKTSNFRTLNFISDKFVMKFEIFFIRSIIDCVYRIYLFILYFRHMKISFHDIISANVYCSFQKVKLFLILKFLKIFIQYF